MSAQPDPGPNASATRLLDQLQTPALLVDDCGDLRFANASARALQAAWQQSGLPDELVGLTHRVGAPDAPLSAHAVNVAGDNRRFDVTLSRLSEPPGWILIELSALQRDWLAGEALLDQHGAVMTLLRGLQHEIRNPLAGIQGAAQLLAQEPDVAARRECLNIIERECARMQRLLAGFGQSAPVEMHRINIHAAVEQALQLLGAETGGSLTVERDYDPSLPEVEGNADALSRALFNLARNARQAGATTLTARSRLARDCLIGATRHHRAVRLDLIDDGPGIPPSLQAVLFYPMVSGRRGGSGMGLAIAQGIAVRHGGLLSFESRPGCTCFTLLLPLGEGTS